MISDVVGHVGKKVSLQGYADDYGKQIIGVEFSLDDGQNWAYFDTSDSQVGKPVQWTYTFTPKQAGLYSLLVRSVNIDGKKSPQCASVTISVLP